MAAAPQRATSRRRSRVPGSGSQTDALGAAGEEGPCGQSHAHGNAGPCGCRSSIIIASSKTGPLSGSGQSSPAASNQGRQGSNG